MICKFHSMSNNLTQTEIKPMSKDLRTIDLPIPSMVEDIEKEIAKMELSNPEIARYKRSIEQNYVMISDLLNLRKSVSNQVNHFLNLASEFYRLRKNICNTSSTMLSELENNNSELRKTFFEIRENISKFDYLRFCLNS